MLRRIFCSMILLVVFGAGSALAKAGAAALPVRSSAPQPVAVQAAQAAQELSIMGAAQATQEQLVAFIRARNPQPRINGTLEELVATYFREGAAEGVRGDVALCQALKETGFFRYGGTVKPQQNNYCGLGTVGAGVGGAHFTTVERGVRAHIQHLLAYSSTERPRQAVIDPRYEMVRKVHPDYAGMITDWTGLNGTWAVPGHGYGQSIIQIWQQAVGDTAVQQSLLQEYTRRISKGDKAAALRRGKLYALQKQYDRALADYQAAEQLAGLRTEALVCMGLVYEAKGEAALAAGAYEKALAADSRSPLALACLNNFRRRSAAVPAPLKGAGGESKMQDSFMREAIKEADSNLHSHEGGPFGAVLVKDGKIVARAHDRVLKQHDATAHAEIEAIRAAGRKLGTYDLAGCELYTSCYPCPMCLSAIVWANIRTVYYGNTAADAGAIGFRNDYIYKYLAGGQQDEAVLELKPLGRDKTISTFQAFAAQAEKRLY